MMQSLSKNYLFILLSLGCFSSFLKGHGLLHELLDKSGYQMAAAAYLNVLELKMSSVGEQFKRISNALCDRFNNDSKNFNLKAVGTIGWPPLLIVPYKHLEEDMSEDVAMVFNAAVTYVFEGMLVEPKKFRDCHSEACIRRLLFSNLAARSKIDWDIAKKKDEKFPLKVACIFFILLPTVLPESCFTQSLPLSILSGGHVSSDDEASSSVGPFSKPSSRSGSLRRSPETPASVAGTPPTKFDLGRGVLGTPEKKKSSQ